MREEKYGSAVPKLLLSAWLSWFVAGVSIAQVIWNLTPLFGSPMIDLAVYLRAIQNTGTFQNPYSFTQTIQPGMSFLYPPGSLLFFLPLNFVSAHTAGILISFLSIACLFATVYLCLQLFRKKFSITEWLILSAFALQTFPIKLGLAMGQVNLIVLFLILAGFFLYQKKQADLAGFLLGVGAVIKLYPLAIIPLLVIKKEWRLLTVFMTTFVLFNLFFPQLLHPYFMQILPDQLTISPGSLPSFYDQSLPALAFRILFSEKIISFLQPAVTLTAYLFVVWKVKKWPLIEASLVVLPLTILLHHPAWQHQLVIGYPAIFLLYPRKSLLFIWAALAFHYQTDSSFLQTNPVFAAVHTTVVLAVITLVLYEQPTLTLPPARKAS